MQLSLLILENYGLDSNYEAMSSYAKSELFLLQRRYAEAFQQMDSISIKFPQSVLNDDLLYLKGKAYAQQGAWEEASNYYQKFIGTYPTELLADDALFQLATIQQLHFKDEMIPSFTSNFFQFSCFIFLSKIFIEINFTFFSLSKLILLLLHE